MRDIAVDKEAPAPSARALRIVDGVASSIRPDDASLEPWFRQYAADHRERLAHDLDLLTRFVPEAARVVEAGSVPLLFTGALREAGYDVVGLDVAPERFAGSVRALGVRVLRCDVERERIPLGDGTAAAVVFNELFEHLRIDPIRTLREVLRVLAPGAPLLLSTPNLRSLSGIYNFLVRGLAYSCSADVYAQYEKLTRLGHMGHVREYTPREVSEFLVKVGFEVERLVFRGGYADGASRLVARALPRLRPFVSVVARRPRRTD